MFSKSNKTLTIIYHGGDEIAHKILAYAQTEGLPIRDIDIAKTKIKESSWVSFAERLGIEVKDLVNMEHPNFTQHYDGEIDLSEEDWLKFLEMNPSTLRAPIVMKGEKIQMMSNPQDMIHFHYDTSQTL